MKKIISILMITVFVIFSSQAIAQKSNDKGGSKNKQEQNNTPNKSNVDKVKAVAELLAYVYKMDNKKQ